MEDLASVQLYNLTKLILVT